MTDHHCQGACNELTAFVLRFAHDMSNRLDAPLHTLESSVFIGAKRTLLIDELRSTKQLLRSFVLCVLGGHDAPLNERTLSHELIESVMHTAARTTSGVQVVSCSGAGKTLNADARLLDLALAAMVFDASQYRYPGTSIELRCDCSADRAQFTVLYDGVSAGNATMLPVPHLHALRIRSDYRSDVGISTPTAQLVAAVHHGVLETAIEEQRQRLRLILPTRGSK